MQIDAIVYTSETGHTRRYAELLSRELGVPAHSFADAKQLVGKDTPVVYMGWLMAGTVKDYGKAKKCFDVKCLIGVGLADTGSLIPEIRKACRVPDDVPVFTAQGGMDRAALKGVYASMIRVLTRVMRSIRNKTPDQQKMTDLLIRGGDFVDGANLRDAVACIRSC